MSDNNNNNNTNNPDTNNNNPDTDKTTTLKYPIGGYAPGAYINECLECKTEYMGDKYSTECEICAINRMVVEHEEMRKELNALRRALEKIEFNHSEINRIINK